MLFLWALAFLLVLQERDLSVKQQNEFLLVSYYHSFFRSQRRTKRDCANTEQAAADPVSMLPGSWGRGSWCHEHDTFHERLDIIEEKVIKTVEHLESEVKSLLNIISETTSKIPIAPGTPPKDIFDDTS